MSFNKKKFEAQLPDFFPELMGELTGFGFIPTLVGGVVRDFIISGSLGHDWDIELTHETLSFNKDLWKNLGKNLTRFGKTTFLSYDVIRVETKDHQLEFSPPRIEKFEEHLAGEGHRNFTVDFDFKMPFSEAVKRRDFTLNAMGIRLKSIKEFEFLDPLEGLRHISEGVLYPAGEDFVKDPVRFLRAIRFARKFKLTFDPHLLKLLEVMSVSNFSSVYLWTEMQKSLDPIGYYQDVLKWQSHHPELKLPVGGELLPHIEDFKKVLMDPTRHETWMIALEWIGISCLSWQQYFSLSSDTCRRLGRWAQESRAFEKILPENFHGDFEVVKALPDFELLFDWYFTTKQLMQKNPNLPLLRMIDEYLPSWIHLYRFEAVKDVKHIDPPLRAMYQVWNLCQRL